MPPLPPDSEPPLLLEQSSRIGPAPTLVPPRVEGPEAAALEADRPDDESGDDEDAEDEAEEEEPYDDEDVLEPDPFISTDAPAIEALSQDDIGRHRAEARALALSGDHRVLLSDIAGPGTLAEALNRLLQEGKVSAEFHDPEGEEPYLLYTPLPAPPPQS
jgi:hypothetical protein